MDKLNTYQYALLTRKRATVFVTVSAKSEDDAIRNLFKLLELEVIEAKYLVYDSSKPGLSTMKPAYCLSKNIIAWYLSGVKPAEGAILV